MVSGVRPLNPRGRSTRNVLPPARLHILKAPLPSQPEPLTGGQVFKYRSLMETVLFQLTTPMSLFIPLFPYPPSSFSSLLLLWEAPLHYHTRNQSCDYLTYNCKHIDQWFQVVKLMVLFYNKTHQPSGQWLPFVDDHYALKSDKKWFFLLCFIHILSKIKLF